MQFRFHQNVMTPKGPAVFIGYFDQGFDCQVARHCVRDGKKIVVNEIYPVGTITEAKAAIHAKPRKGTVSQVLDVAIE